MEDRDFSASPAPQAALLAAPSLGSVVPSTGPVAGNNSVTLSGTGFSGITAVSFGSRPASGFTVNSTTAITATVPPGTGVVPVTVKSPGGTSNSVSYTYAATPTLTSLLPSQGPTSGGTAVTLTGSGLTGATAVDFGANSVSFTVNSPTQITAVAPAGTSAVPVTVTTPGGISTAVYFFYLALPAVTAVSPVQGPTSGGTTVTLTGSGFTGVTAVKFGANSANFTVNSSTQITAVAPAGTGAVPVTVTTPGGTSNSVAYSYVAPPVLTTLSPAQGPISAGAVITLIGTGLTTATAVHFGPALAGFSVASDTSIVAVAPAGAAGSVPVTVTTPGGTSNALTYIRVPPPGI